MPLQRKPLPVVADSAAYAKATACQGILVPGYDSTELAEVWMFLDFTIRAFLNIPAKDGIFAALRLALVTGYDSTELAEVWLLITAYCSLIPDP